MLLSRFLKEGTASLEALYPLEEARGIVQLLCEHVLGVKSYTHITEPGYCIEEEFLDSLRAAMTRLCAGEPVQYVLGESEFYSRRFRLTPDVLIPRAETELLCREALKLLRPSSGVLDLCTGSGCIAWTVALESPGTEVLAVDISKAALELAQSQDFSSEMSGSGALAPDFIQADILDFQTAFTQRKFDMILSNPPYVMEKEKAAMRKNVLDYEPSIALFVPDNDPLLFYRAVAHWAERLLLPGGCGFVEINEGLGEETASVFRDRGFDSVCVLKDFYEKNRYILFRKTLV